MWIPFPAGVPGGPRRGPARRPAPLPHRCPAVPGCTPALGLALAECVESRTRQLVVQSGEWGILRTRVLKFFRPRAALDLLGVRPRGLCLSVNSF